MIRCVNSCWNQLPQTLVGATTPMRMIRTHSQQAQVSTATHQRLNRFLYLSRQLYNAALDERINAYRKAGESIGLYDQYTSFTQIRRDDAEMSSYGVQPFRSVLNRLDRSFKRFFRQGGFPRFKGRNRGIRSFETHQFRIRVSGTRHAVQIKGFGRFIAKAVPEGEITLVRIVKTPVRVMVQFVCEQEREVSVDQSPVVGIDVGVKARATLSTGESVPKVVINRERSTRLQRRLSTAKKGSHNRYKKKQSLAKEAYRVAERQRNAVHRTTTDLVKRQRHFAVEDLKIKNMTAHGGNHKRGLNRSILEQQWGTFIQQLTYTAESAGGSVVKVNPRNTSKTCSGCGSVHESLTLKDRVFECEQCGLSLDRDLNAALNIRELGSSGGKLPDMRPDGVPIGGVTRRAA